MRKSDFFYCLLAITTFLGCGELMNNFSNQRGDTEALDTQQVSVLSDKNGVITAQVDPNSNTYQVLSASQNSNVKDAEITFPPGSFSIPTQVSIEEG